MPSKLEKSFVAKKTYAVTGATGHVGNIVTDCLTGNGTITLDPGAS